jgi:hypothetical protein
MFIHAPDLARTLKILARNLDGTSLWYKCAAQMTEVAANSSAAFRFMFPVLSLQAARRSSTRGNGSGPSSSAAGHGLAGVVAALELQAGHCLGRLCVGWRGT